MVYATPAKDVRTMKSEKYQGAAAALRRTRLMTAALVLCGLSAVASAQQASSASAQQTAAPSTPAAAQKADTASTAPVFVPPEVEGAGGHWIVPDDAKGEMAVRSIAPRSTPGASATPTPATPPVAAAAPTAESAEFEDESAAPQTGQRTSVAPPRTPEPSDEEESAEQETAARPTSEGVAKAKSSAPSSPQDEVVPPRPTRITVVGRVESVRSLPRNELELTVKTRDRGRVRVVVSPLEVQRVPGKGREIRARGVIIREGRDNLTIRAMDISTADEGAALAPEPAPAVAPAPPAVVAPVPVAPPVSLSIGYFHSHR
jgi:hypothetical protein